MGIEADSNAKGPVVVEPGMASEGEIDECLIQEHRDELHLKVIIKVAVISIVLEVPAKQRGRVHNDIEHVG